ncbi:MAG: HEAT repeat domain-containing protein [Thermosynechococcaceae cyanobacterium]
MTVETTTLRPSPTALTHWRRILAAMLLSLVLLGSILPSAIAQTQTSDDARIAPLIEKLTDRNSRQRLEAADALINIGTPALPALVTALQSPDPNLRWHAATVLGDLGPEAASAVPDLMVALQDTDPQVRLYTTLALGNLGKSAKAAVPSLIAALRDPDAYVRIYVPTALLKIGAQGEVAVSALTVVLRDPNPRVRLNAAYALGALGREAESAIPNLVETLLDPQAYVRMGAVKGLASIAGAFQDQAKTLPSRKLTSLITTFEQVLSLLENPTQGFTTDDMVRIRRPLNALKAEQENRLWDKVLGTIQQHPWWAAVAIYVLTLPVICALLLQIAPLWILSINDALKPYTDFAVPFLGINIPLRSLLLVGWFHYHPRVLDAWVSQHLSTARVQFSQKPTVRDRQNWIPLPTVLDGTTVAQLQAADLRPAFGPQRSRLIIYGEGGIGKTSLACQIGQWAMAPDTSQRLCPHAMLPILLEEPFPVGNESAVSPLVTAIQGQLQALIDAPEPVNLPLMERLLRQQRLLVIADRFSEMPPATREAIQPDLPDFPVNALVVTSRSEEALGRSHRTAIKPLRIEGNKLSSFMEAYLMQQGQRDRLNDDEFFAACQHLSLMVGPRPIPVLLAKLYAELLIRMLQPSQLEPDLSALPEDVPSLMLGYLNELNRDIATHPLEDRMVHQDAKALAWACVKTQFYPNAISRTEAIAAIAALDRPEPEVHLNYLEQTLRLIETVGAGQDRVRFCLDPLAEYLAALAVVERLGQQASQWQTTILKPAEGLRTSVPIETMRVFLWAIQDVYQTRYPQVNQSPAMTRLLVQLAELTQRDVSAKL